MPAPVSIRGALPKYARKQFAQTGMLTDSVSFDPEVDIQRIKASEEGALRQTRQVQVWVGDLNIEVKGTPIADANGLMTGLAAAAPGQSVTCVHFAAATVVDGVETVPAIERCGFTRDDNKLLYVGAPKLELGGEDPQITIPMTYCRFVSKEELSLLVA